MKMGGPQPFSISNMQNHQSFARSSVAMMSATSVELQREIDDEYYEQNIPIRPRNLENKETENYWDELMKNREPLKLPYWVEEDGMQVIKNDEKRKIGWIGLGETGHQLAFLLTRAGYDVTVFDKSKEKAADLVKFGAKLSNDANSVAAQSDYLFLCVGHIKNLVDLMENSEYGIYDDIKTGSIVVNHSPRDPDFEHDEKIFLKSRHCSLLDAPIHFGDNETHEMKQELQVGGVQSEFEHVQELLKLYATKLRYIGDQEVCANEDFPCDVPE